MGVGGTWKDGAEWAGGATRAVDAVVLGGLGLAGLTALTHSLLLAMGYPRPLPAVAAAAVLELVAAVLLGRFTREAAGVLAGVAALAALACTGDPGRAALARALAWARGGLRVLAGWARGTPPVLTEDVAWAGAVLAPLAVAAAVTGLCARRRDPFWPLVGGAAIPVLEWFSYFDRGLDFLTLYLVLAAAWLAAWRAGEARPQPEDAGRGPAGEARRADRGGGGPTGEARRPDRGGGGPAGVRWDRPRLPLSEGFTGARAALWAGLLAALLLVPARGADPYPSVSPGRVADWLVEAVPGMGRLRGGGVERVGFNPDTRQLGGPVAPGSRVALGVRVTRAVPGPVPVASDLPRSLYLRGTVRDTYTGRGWEGESYRAEFPDRMGRTVPLEQEQFISALDVEMEVRHRGLPYLYVFSPWIPVGVEGAGEILSTVDYELTAAVQPREYAVRAQVPLRTAGELNVFIPVNPDWRDRYLQLPPGLPAAVAEQARRLTAGARTPYECACRIEEYLRREYPYDQGVRRPPAGEDFVADFLFGLRRGYCAHHSTAMAVMLRTLGIRTRWVQGFVVDLDVGRWQDVPQSSAHAWVEVLIPGCGWVTFDPTPRYPVPEREHVPAPPREGEAGPAPGGTGGAAGPVPGRPFDEMEPPGPGQVGYPGAGAGGGLPRWLLPALLLAGLAVPAARGVGRALGLRAAQRPRRGESARDFVLRQYALAERYLASAGLVRPAWLTPREFLGALDAECRERGTSLSREAGAALAHLTAAVEEAAFSPPGRGVPVPPGEVAAVARWARGVLGWWRWLCWLAWGAAPRRGAGGAGPRRVLPGWGPTGPGRAG